MPQKGEIRNSESCSFILPKGEIAKMKTADEMRTIATRVQEEEQARVN